MKILDKNLLRYMTVKVKKFDLETKYFSKKEKYEKKEYKKTNYANQKKEVEIKKVNKVILQN